MLKPSPSSFKLSTELLTACRAVSCYAAITASRLLGIMVFIDIGR